ncbi:DUF2797 domain-containing protein [Flavobacteriales bacterium]|jgi:hypothetical protein|nr:DUF2797 domain-containing protein [Flavobacteriales bacterium]
MKITGGLLKMKAELKAPIHYHLPIGSELIDVNSLINKRIRLTYENDIFCINCGAKTYKSFNQGMCYPCFQSSPLASECIIHPERCQAHLGIGRDMEWETKYHLTPQIVYLALTANAKVGITRKPQIPTRWIDQGAVQTIVLAEAPNRYLAGMIEVSLKAFIADKTHWQKMLKNQINPDVNLLELKKEMTQNLSPELRKYVVDSELQDLSYPVLEYPEKVKSLSFDKLPVVEGVLTGIKGQYLMFDYLNVLNVRKHQGYVVSLEY